MSEKNMTALVSCFARAYHSKNYQTKIFDDYYAEKIMTKEEYENISLNMKNGIKFFNPNFEGTSDEGLRWIVDNQLSPSVLGRSAFAEKALENAKMLGVKQYIIFASGYDTYAYRNKDTDLIVFEVDKKEMLEDKLTRLQRAKIDYSIKNYVEADFNSQDWTRGLLNSAYNPSQRSFCSLLGISYYLSQEAFAKTLKSISEVICKGSTIVFDYPTFDETINERINQQLAKKADEEMKAKYSLENIEKILEECNILVYENLDADEMTRQYFEKYNFLNPNNKIVAPKGVSYCLAVKQ